MQLHELIELIKRRHPSRSYYAFSNVFEENDLPKIWAVDQIEDNMEVSLRKYSFHGNYPKGNQISSEGGAYFEDLRSALNAFKHKIFDLHVDTIFDRIEEEIDIEH